MRARWVIAPVVVGLLCRPEPARALFGEEQWIGGQNELLTQLLITQLEELTEITTLVTNARMVLGATNDALALARTVKRVYEIARTYGVEQLVADARRGLYRAMPELANTDREVRELIESRLAARYVEMAKRGGPGERTWEFDRKSSDVFARSAAREWHGALSERGWVAPHWPKEYGGAGLSSVEQFILNEELATAGAPAVGGSGVSTLGPTIIVHGTPEQRARYLPPILAGEVAWAQGYSEPGAGSDLGSLATRATRDGDEFVLDGQKIWTSGAHTADAVFALVRTNPAAPKHKGISFVLIEDIKSPGISVRPLLDLGGRHYLSLIHI